MNMIRKLKQDKELWNTFTRKEEYHPEILDRYGRFPYYASSNRNILEPKIEQRAVFGNLTRCVCC